jgi:AcrR family transcriptional regulator
MSESKGGSLGSPGEGARKPGRDGGKPGTGARKAAGGARKAAESAGSARKTAGSAGSPRKPAKGSGKAKQRAAPKITPIYARLPRGPHPLGAPGVARNQRIRIHGGMIEAVTTRGYPQTSVKLVIGLAGVSRRSFYEQFSGKEECFMATFDLIANRTIKRLTDAYRTAEGDQRQRLRATLHALGAELEQNPKALRLAIAESQAAGAEGLRRLQKTTAVYEGLLANALSGRCPPPGGGAGEGEVGSRARAGIAPAEEGRAGEAGGVSVADGGRPGAGAETDNPETLPLPVVRAIVGGLRRATQMLLLDEDTEDLEPLVGEMLKWTLLFNSPALARLRPRCCEHQPFPETLELEPDACGGESRRARVLRSAIETGLRERKFADLSAPRIAEGAGLPFEAVTELYPDPQACYLEALDVLGDELLQLIATPELVSAEWPAAVCNAIDALLAHLAGSPARLMTLTVKALEAGPVAIANIGDLAYELATLLTEGATRRARTRIAIEGIAGGLWNILYCEALAGRGHRLLLLSEYISYVVLTPYLGPEEAVEAVVASRAVAASQERQPGQNSSATATGSTARAKAAAGNGTAAHQAAPTNGSAPAGEQEGEDYLRLAERRSAKCVNTTPTSTESTITTIKGA